MSYKHVVIVGGAILGSICAWSMRQQGFKGRITVVDKDASYSHCSTSLSAACIRLQFATPLNIHMSLYGVEFLRNVISHLGPGTEIGYIENGYLILGETAQIEQRRALIDLQRSVGADVIALTPDDIASRFPMIDVDGVGVGSYGVSGEGWFDAYSLMRAARGAAISSGVEYVEAEVYGFSRTGNDISGVVTTDRNTLYCDCCVLAAGAWSGQLAGLLDIDLPVVPKKRTAFYFRAPLDGRGLPMIVDTTGFWLRPEQNGFIGGIYPPAEDDHDAFDDFEPHHSLFESSFWPALAARIPLMQELRLERAWAGHYEMNTLDNNGVVGFHHEIDNLIFATGFSGHGVMHAPAIGRGVAELVAEGAYRSLDLSPLGWRRIVENKPFIESVVI